MHILYTPVQPQDREKFKLMTFPAFRHLLNGEPAFKFLDMPSDWVIPAHMAAYLGSEPCGLVLAAIFKEKNEAEVISLFVPTSFRQQGIGTALLKNLETILRQQNYQRMTAVYMSGNPGTNALERVLQKCEWTPPYTRMASIRFTYESFKQVPWLEKYKPIKGYQTFPWMEISLKERQALRQSQETKPWIPKDLVPWLYDEDGFESITSLGIRYEGSIVGWLINHRHDHETLRITCGYIREDLGKMGLILPAAVEAFHLMPKAGFSQGMFTTPVHHPKMIAFIKNWIAPWSIYHGETRGVYKLL